MPEAIDTMFEQAVDALKRGDRVRSRELLTRLIKANQRSATYWLWMSAAVDNTKECIYCLETVLKLEPANEAAKRGLMLLGAGPPARNVRPFSLNRKRNWESRLMLADEAPPQTALQAFTANPVVQLSATLLTGIVLIAAVLLVGFNVRSATFRPSTWRTPTPGAAGAPIDLAAIVAATENVPTPLAVLLGIAYTPTPLYVGTPRAPVSAAAFLAAQEALKRDDMDDFVRMMDEVQAAEPEAADVQYQIAEVYRQRGECRTALYYYNEALKVDDQFAPAYLGLARARLCTEPGANVLQLYELAQDADAAYGEVYLDRAFYYIGKDNYKDALPDLQQAQRLMPRSALVHLGYTQTYVLQDKPSNALIEAEKAYAIDKTLLPVYYYLGRTRVETGEFEEAIDPLQIFVLYEAENAEAWTLLGTALAETGQFGEAVEALNQAIRIDRNQANAFLPLGVSYLELGNMAGAEVNFRRALEYFPDSFDANIGLTEIYYFDGTFGTAYLQAETSFSKATNDNERALAIYWRALSHEGRRSWAEAMTDWRTLLALPARAMSPEIRAEAQERLKAIPTLTPTFKPGATTATPTRTPTPRPGSTATPAS